MTRWLHDYVDILLDEFKEKEISRPTSLHDHYNNFRTVITMQVFMTHCEKQLHTVRKRTQLCS